MTEIKAPQSTTVNLAAEYPIYKQDGKNLILLPSHNSNRRYSLTSNVQTGETYYLEYTDELKGTVPFVYNKLQKIRN